MTRPFVDLQYPHKIVLERITIIQELVRFVLAGTKSSFPIADNQSKFGSFQDDVNTQLLELLKAADTNELHQQSSSCRGNTVELLVETVEEMAKRLGIPLKFVVCPPFRSHDLRRDFTRMLSVTAPEAWVEAEPTVEGAYFKAWQNFMQTETRLLMLNAIASLLRERVYGRANFAQASEIEQCLRTKRLYFLLSMSMFAGLIGGQAIKEVTRVLADDKCYREDKSDIQYNVIHFLTADGIVPGGWPRETEDLFNADIAKHVKQLGV